MKYSIPITLLLLLHLTSIAQKTHRNNKSIETLTFNNIQKDYKTLLIVGWGNMASRKFIHDIIYELNKRLIEDDISCKYEYLGTEEAQIQENLQKAIRENKHDAILMITPLSSRVEYLPSYSAMAAERSRLQGLGNNSDAVSYYERIHEKIDIQIIEDTKGMPVWRALLQTSVNMDAQKVFAAISRNLITEMKKNMLIVSKKK